MKSSRLLALFVAAVLPLAAGCAETVPPGEDHDHAAGTHAAGESDDAAGETTHAAPGHTHGGWWCDEHGVPEEVCGLCNSKLAAEFQRKGDWCADHDRPDSQCFVCHPELQARFAAQYEAKYGKKPPQPAG